jgi:hypothetical protein
MDIGRSHWRRALDGLYSLSTWVIAAGIALWFYDWLNRWYVAVAFVLSFVIVAIMIERHGHRRGSAIVALAVVPTQREPEPDVDDWLSAEMPA